MRYILLAVMLGSMMTWGSTLQAEMYKYRDAQGNVCFTDNIALVPEDQRPTAHSMETISTDDASDPSKEEITAEPDTGDQADADDAEELIVNEETIDALNDRKQELDSEFSALMAEKYALLQEKDKLAGLAGRNVEARKAYEGKVTDLNNRIADYQARRDAFQKECDQVKKVLEPPMPEEDTEAPIE